MIPALFINCRRYPFAGWIMGGLKLYETRTRNTLKRLMGMRVLIVETGRGAPVVRCSAVIDEVVEIRTRAEWEEYLEFTWVPVGSEYDWTPTTKVKYLYHLSDVHACEPFVLPATCRRHGRVWAEYEGKVIA